MLPKLKVFVFVCILGVLLVQLPVWGQSWAPSGNYGYGVIGADQDWCDWKTEKGNISFSEGSLQTTFSESANKCPDNNYCKPEDSESSSYQVMSAGLITFNDAQLVFSKDDSVLVGGGVMGAGSGGPLLAVGVKKGITTSSPSGDYYLMSYEKDLLGEDKGQNRLSMGTIQFSGTVATTNEKLACNGTQCVNGLYSGKSESFPYKVETDGTFKVCMKEEGSCQDNEFVPFGHIGSDGKVAVMTNTGVFYPNTANDFMLVVSLKKGDKQYSKADLEGKWVIGGFGDEEGVLVGLLCVMSCDSGGTCSGTIKKHTKSTQKIESFSTTFTVDQYGSINGFENGPSYDTLRGVIGNNGNTILMGIGRVMMVGVKTDASVSITGLALKKGWNLVGLVSGNAKGISELVQGKENNIASVWKWVHSKQGWAVYLPKLEKQSPGSTTQYASSKGFEVISTINPGEGFWVNVVDIGDDESIVIDY